MQLQFSYCQLVSIYKGLKKLHSGSHFEVNHLLTMVTQNSGLCPFHLPFGDLHSLPFWLSHPTFCRHAFKATLCGKRASSESSSLVTIETLKLSFIMSTFYFVKCFMEHCKIYCIFLLLTSLWFSLCQNMLSYLSQVNSTRNLIFCSGLYRILFEKDYFSAKKKKQIIPSLFPAVHTIKSFVKVELASMEGHLQRKPFWEATSVFGT